MKTFKNVQEWLETNPSEDELKKVIDLINKGAVNQTRREVYDLERYLRKLQSGANHLVKLELEPPKDLTDRIKSVKKEIAELSKGLPPRQTRKKENVES